MLLSSTAGRDFRNERGNENLITIIPDRLYFISMSATPNSSSYPDFHFFSTDNELVYFNFFLDFGPLNLGQLYRFCMNLNKKLEDPNLKKKKIVYFTGVHAHKRTNGTCLITSWSLLYNKKTPEQAFAPFRGFSPPFPPFHDASPANCTYNLSILDVLRGLYKARQFGFFDFKTFDVQEYEFYEQVENGDLNWIVKDKFIGFAGPQEAKYGGIASFRMTSPAHYIPYFKRHNVKLVVRLNKKYYDENRFKNVGIDHIDLYYLDGSVPSRQILNTFLSACEQYMDGAIAVHCKAGLGRTGTCIGCYLIKHFRMTAAEVIGWIRLARPGSIIGPQQQYLEQMQASLWQEGDSVRVANRLSSSLQRSLSAGRSRGSTAQSYHRAGGSETINCGEERSLSSTPKSSSSSLLSRDSRFEQKDTPISRCMRSDRWSLGQTSGYSANPTDNTTSTPAGRRRISDLSVTCREEHPPAADAKSPNRLELDRSPSGSRFKREGAASVPSRSLSAGRASAFQAERRSFTPSSYSKGMASREQPTGGVMSSVSQKNDYSQNAAESKSRAPHWLHSFGNSGQGQGEHKQLSSRGDTASNPPNSTPQQLTQGDLLRQRRAKSKMPVFVKS